ncbi:hypothetical protein TNCV_4237921 [Trichonephila clavipes]|nr:hypothetical protein TNCV_4237921 [Trichonephila clavipes]
MPAMVGYLNHWATAAPKDPGGEVNRNPSPLQPSELEDGQTGSDSHLVFMHRGSQEVRSWSSVELQLKQA